ncbi:hypothetical protein [Chryseosolibacter indicus]|uniref:Uncharacterized protein n=1 Tax=Chryseosolibacter indicus TaxID=2782351 RepID=A0ABS5VPS7_9BACT|nr:hypothetical protein [Chryseosolibacter indicus]MBT1703341.1 hypothetical protein [Chryseosolibacter indicus]
MNLNITISDITSRLISLYAIMDSWCDEFNELTNEQCPNQRFIETFAFINDVNEFMLTALQQLDEGKDVHFCTLESQVAFLSPHIKEDLCAYINLNSLNSTNRVFSNLNNDQVRGTLREQLYRYLMLLEQIENTNNLLSQARSEILLKIIQTLVNEACGLDTTIAQRRLTY